jgi:hypothetical protein
MVVARTPCASTALFYCLIRHTLYLQYFIKQYCVKGMWINVSGKWIPSNHTKMLSAAGIREVRTREN